MISFLRKNAAIVGWMIVIFFGATLFSTSFFFGGGSPETDRETMQNIQNAIAVVDGQPLDNVRFQTYYNQLLTQVDLSKTGGQVSPEVMEMILYNSAMQTVQDMAVLKAANLAEIDVSKQEIKQVVNSSVMQSGLTSQKELKNQLKESGMSFSAFKDNIRDNLMIQKFTKQLQDKVVVTDQDVDNQFVRVNVRHILVKAAHLEAYDRELLAQELYDVLQKKELTFEQAVQKYSEDVQTRKRNGVLGWVQAGQTIPEFEEVAFSLDINQISRPVKTVHGYHILEVLDRQEMPKPPEINYDEERKRLLERKQKTVIPELMQPLLIGDKLSFNWPLLKAHHAKRSGDVATAEVAYQLLSSQQSFSPVPHYLLSNLYLLSNQMEKAKSELKKAQVKIDIDDRQAFPEFYLLAAKIYDKDNRISDRNKAYDAAFDLAESSNLIVLNELKQIFEQKKYGSRLKKVDRAIAAFEERLAEEEALKKKAREEQLAIEAGLVTENAGL